MSLIKNTDNEFRYLGRAVADDRYCAKRCQEIQIWKGNQKTAF
jgi:hypothetical protein